jgi:amino acid adenylation domain-containing protein
MNFNLVNSQVSSPLDNAKAVQSGHKTLAEVFDEVAEKYAGRTALTYADVHLSYDELNRRASGLATRLHHLGLQRESLVAVFMERSAETIVVLLAILKAGGAYLPLDPASPRERIATILEDARPTVLVTERQLIDKLPRREAHTLCIDGEGLADPVSAEPNIALPPRPENLAYVIYTSGSTGKPKGVMVTHANVIRLLSATTDWFHFDERDVWTFFHSYAFDFSVWEIWGCLLHGGRLVVVPFSVTRSPLDFYDLLVKEQVTVLNQTPSAFYQLIAVDEVKRSADFALRIIIFGGEALNFKMLRPWFAAHDDQKPQLVNMYGITETTVHVTYRIVTAADAADGAHSLIGVPIPDLQLYLLDDHLQPVSNGTTGEIYVGGAGVARGYLHRPELNLQRFLPDPFSKDPDARLYKSGDLARVLSNGELEYLGRGDAQVKIQGFRIELGEIEAAIAQYEQIREVHVVVHTDNMQNKRLVAYYTARDGATINTSELSDFLSPKLPSYMRPAVYMQVVTFPLTPNGKMDHAALPAPTLGSTKTLEPEGSDFEREIAMVWQKMLGAAHVGLDDNFFDIGGTSLLLASVHTELQTLLQVPIPITDLFAYTTVRALSAKLQQAAPSAEGLNRLQNQAQKQRDAFARARTQKKALL